MAGEIYAVPGETMTAIANAIRSKTGSDDFMTVASMASAIGEISGGMRIIKGGTYVPTISSTKADFSMPKTAKGFFLFDKLGSIYGGGDAYVAFSFTQFSGIATNGDMYGIGFVAWGNDSVFLSTSGNSVEETDDELILHAIFRYTLKAGREYDWYYITR